MKTHTATIYDGDKPILENITVYLEETTKGDGVGSWYGAFRLRWGQDIEMSKRHMMKIEDGRSGDILIRGVNMSPHGYKQVSFVGTGPLR